MPPVHRGLREGCYLPSEIGPVLTRLIKIGGLFVSGWLAVWGVASLAAPKVVDGVVAKVLPRIQGGRLAVDSLSYGQIQVSPSRAGNVTREKRISSVSVLNTCPNR